jgi:hypothetical protein
MVLAVFHILGTKFGTRCKLFVMNDLRLTAPCRVSRQRQQAFYIEPQRFKPLWVLARGRRAFSRGIQDCQHKEPLAVRVVAVDCIHEPERYQRICHQYYSQAMARVHFGQSFDLTTSRGERG